MKFYSMTNNLFLIIYNLLKIILIDFYSISLKLYNSIDYINILVIYGICMGIFYDLHHRS